MNRNTLLQIFLLVIVGLYFFYFYLKINTSGYLHFSDAAKFADVAKNLVESKGYGADFSFFDINIFRHSYDGMFSARLIPLMMPYSIAISFSLLGISDFSIIATSGLFYLALVIATYFLGRYLFGTLVGFLSSLAVLANVNFLDYATSGASEPLFSFLTVLSAYLGLLRKKWTNFFFFITLILLYLTRPQGFVFISILLFMWLVKNLSLKKATVSILGFFLSAFLIDKYILYPLSWKTAVYPIFTRGLQAFWQYASNVSISDGLRGGVAQITTLSALGKKVFWNLYNFYRLLPQIASPYLWALFAIGVFKREKEKEGSIFKVTSLLLVIGNFILVAMTIPFFRYLHPVIPFVYIVATATLVSIVEKVTGEWLLVTSGKLKTLITNHKSLITTIVSSFLLLFFAVGQTLGVIFLDSRFEAKRVNRGKPPVYVQLSYILRDNTSPDDVVVTNLDTWGSWYGERRTIWFSLEPDQLKGLENEIDAIYLTSYLIDDENYYMGDEWRQIFYDPESKTDEFISGNYELKKVFEVSASENYERQDVRAILLVKK